MGTFRQINVACCFIAFRIYIVLTFYVFFQFIAKEYFQLYFPIHAALHIIWYGWRSVVSFTICIITW